MNILIAGVGGQGNILLSRVICQMYMKRGYHVKTAENIGMSQRGGSVVSFIRIADDIGPIIPKESADLLIGLELCEALRNVTKLNKSSTIALNNRYIKPNDGEIDKEEIIHYFKDNYRFLHIFEAHKIAKKNDIPKAENIAMLSLMCKNNILPFDAFEIIEALSEFLPAELLEKNKILVESIFSKG